MDTLVLLKLLIRNLDQTPSGDQTATATVGQSQIGANCLLCSTVKRLYRLNWNVYQYYIKFQLYFTNVDVESYHVILKLIRANSNNMLILCAISCQSTLPLIKHLNKRTWRKTTTFCAKNGMCFQLRAVDPWVHFPAQFTSVSCQVHDTRDQSEQQDYRLHSGSVLSSGCGSSCKIQHSS